MYYTGIDPRTMKKVYVPKSFHEKAMQRALLQWKRPEKRELVEEALRTAGRRELIGYGKNCFIRPEKDRRQENFGKKTEKKVGASRPTDMGKTSRPRKKRK